MSAGLGVGLGLVVNFTGIDRPSVDCRCLAARTQLVRSPGDSSLAPMILVQILMSHHS